jgi:hypothetical protein
MPSEPSSASGMSHDLDRAIARVLSRLESDLGGIDPTKPESERLVEPINQMRRSLERLRQSVREPEPDHERTDR